MPEVIFVTKDVLEKLADVNSCKELSERGRAKAIADFNGLEYIVIGDVSSGQGGTISVQAYRCFDSDKYPEPIERRKYSYHGTRCQVRDRKLVLIGDEVTFKTAKPPRMTPEEFFKPFKQSPMTKRGYADKVKTLILENKDLINISALELRAKFPKNSLRKALGGTRELDAREASRCAGVLHQLGFTFSALQLSDQEINRLPYR